MLLFEHNVSVNYRKTNHSEVVYNRCTPHQALTVNTGLPFQAKLLFSDGEKVIPRLAHELPGIKVRITA